MPPPLVHVPSKLRKKIEWLFRRAEGALLPEAVLAAEGAHLDPEGARLALLACEDEVAIAGAGERLARLSSRDPGYADRWGICGVERFRAGTGARIYQLAVETFPRHVNNVHVIVEGDATMIVDAGSGRPSSRRDLALGFAVVRAVFGEDRVRWEDLSWCLVSHAHGDHFGGVGVLREGSRAELAVHELDAPAVASFEERFATVAAELDRYWQRAGVDDATRAALRELYAAGKRLFRSAPVGRTLRDGDLLGPGYRVHHVPGHCPGLVCLQVHDVLLTSDHVLARITPHQFPPSIAPFGGLAHYFESLAKIRAVEGVRLALGGHEEPIVDVPRRIDEIVAFHERRLERVLDACRTPRTISEVARELFGEQEGYGIILALDEAGAHVEHLHALGRLEASGGRFAVR